MKLYEVLATEYKEIFPSSQEKVDFVEKYLVKEKSQYILDIGCASGEFVYQLSSPSRNIIGIDLDPLMIEEARVQSITSPDGTIQFYQADMLHFLYDSKPESYDMISCFGNTIVYLDGESELKSFLLSAHDALKKKGKMIIQILNYSNPKIAPGFVFPTVETDKLEFNREYVPIDGSEKLGFKTSIIDRVTGETDTDLHKHYPFLSPMIGETAQEAGFTDTHIYGGYDGKEADDSDFFHLIVLEK